MSGSKKCLAILAQGAEEIEVVAPVDILRRAGFEVTVAALDGSGFVKCSRNVVICPDANLTDVVNNDYDVVLIPGGGEGVKNIKKSELVKNLLKKQEEAGRVIAAICAGPTVLKEFSVALKKKITSYPSTKDQLSDGSYTYSDERTVVDDNVITSQGPGTAVEFGLAIVEKVLGSDTRSKIAKQLIF